MIDKLYGIQSRLKQFAGVVHALYLYLLWL